MLVAGGMEVELPGRIRGGVGIQEKTNLLLVSGA